MNDSEFLFQAVEEHFPLFEPHGYGPFTVAREGLVSKIIAEASPKSSVHISGCRAAGKTILLHEIGKKLVQQQQQNNKVYYFNSSSLLDDGEVRKLLKSKIQSGEKVYVLVDETQANSEASLFIDLLKGMKQHNVTTIGAGIALETKLEDEGVVEFFTTAFFPSTILDDTARAEIGRLLRYIRWYVGGHIYPLMWFAQNLAPRIAGSEQDPPLSFAQVRQFMASPTFQGSREYAEMVDRILPTFQVDIRPLFHTRPDQAALLNLRKVGLCNSNNKVPSYLLLESILAKTEPSSPVPATLLSLQQGLVGVKQLLSFALPYLDWSSYDGFGGPTEDALTHELLTILNKVQNLSTSIFNPKLIVDAGTVGRRPDIFFHSTVNAFVECVYAAANNDASTVKDIENHIHRFTGNPPHYQIGTSDFAILSYQRQGSYPIQLQYLDRRNDIGPLSAEAKQAMKDTFERRTFTFLMETGALYLGNTEIVLPRSG